MHWNYFGGNPFNNTKFYYLEQVERERQKDAANGLEVAKALEGFVKRKVNKFVWQNYKCESF